MRLLHLVVFASLVSSVTNGARASNAQKWKPEANLNIKVYNYAKVSDAMLAQGEEIAAWIFRQAGIEVRWIDCPTFAKDILKFPACTEIVDPSARIIKILPRSMAEQFGLPAAKAGFALRPNQAFVFFDRVLGVTKDTGFSRPRVLGHVMAHELGHLLLEGENHTTTGIMSANVLTRDGPDVMLRLFTTSQSERMHAQLQAEILATK